MDLKNKTKRGFAALDPDTRKAISSAGGKAVHAQGKGHEFTTEEARVAGAKGGAAVAKDVAHMAEIGRRGGLARHRRLDSEAAE
jgi:general stress protein YciG